MTFRPIYLLALAVLPLAAQEKKPAKPDVSAEDRAKVNARLKELRNKDEIKKAWDIVEKAAERNKNAETEVARLKKDGTDLTSEEAKKKLESMKDFLSPEDKEALKKVMESVKPEAEAAIEQQRQKMRQQQGKSAPNPLPEAPVRPDTFDNVPPPAPLPPLKAIVFPAAPLSAHKFIKGPERDPKNPDIELPASDVRRRTWVAEGEVRVRLATQLIAVDADEVTILWKAGNGPGAKQNQKQVKDPLAKNQQDSPFERLIAKGRVRILFVDSYGRVQVGRGGYMIYDQKTGEFLLKDWPELQVDNKLLVSESKDGVLRMGKKLREGDFIGGVKVETLESPLSEEDFPAERATPIPDAGPRKEANKVP